MSGELPSASGGLAPGSRIASYLIEKQVGRGGMAVVYRASDPRLNRSVALKILAPELADDAAFRQRFMREMRAAPICTRWAAPRSRCWPARRRSSGTRAWR